MTIKKPTAFRADYYYQKIGGAARTRTGHVGSVSQHLHGATFYPPQKKSRINHNEE
jgi:hypothetical protein